MRGAPRMQAAEEHTGEKRKAERKAKDCQIEFWQRLPEQRRSQIATCVSQRGSGDAAGDRQQEILREYLAENARSACAERDAQADLLLPRRGPRQKQVGEIGAGQQQYEKSECAENGVDLQEMVPVRVLSTIAGSDGHAHGVEINVASRLQCVLDRLPEDPGERGLRLHVGDAGLDSPEHTQPPGLWVSQAAGALVGRENRLHREGKEDFRVRIDCESFKAARRDAYNGERDAIDLDRFSDDGGRARKARLPECIAENDGVAFSCSQIIRWEQKAASLRLESQSGEEIAGDIFGAPRIAISFERNLHTAGVSVSHQLGEGGALSQVLISLAGECR